MATFPKKSDEDARVDAVPPEQDPSGPALPPVAPEPDPVKPEPVKYKFVLVNPGTSTLVYTEDARMLSGGQRVGVDSLDSVGQAMVDRGYLLLRLSQ
jgi:hypothetical protein